MSLLLASVRPHDVVLTADGRSTRRAGGRVTSIDDAFQKLIPVPDHPIVVAHHGENSLDGKPVRDFLAPFLRDVHAGDLTLLEVADELRHFVHPHVRQRLRDVNDPTDGCGFWVAGFGRGGADESPAMVEVFYIWRDGVLASEERRWAPLSVVAGGDGKSQADALDWRQVSEKPLDAVRAYHGRLMAQAIGAKVDPNSVGGHVHELVVTRDGWRWTLPPATRPAPATAPATTRP